MNSRYLYNKSEVKRIYGVGIYDYLYLVEKTNVDKFAAVVLEDEYYISYGEEIDEHIDLIMTINSELNVFSNRPILGGIGREVNFSSYNELTISELKYLLEIIDEILIYHNDYPEETIYINIKFDHDKYKSSNLDTLPILRNQVFDLIKEKDNTLKLR